MYDVTVYMDFHPGGNILLQGCGKECAGLFSIFFTYCRQVSPVGECEVFVGKVSDRVFAVNINLNRGNVTIGKFVFIFFLTMPKAFLNGMLFNLHKSCLKVGFY